MTEITADTDLPEIGPAPVRPDPIQADLNLGITDSQKKWLDEMVGQTWSISAKVNSWEVSSEDESDVILTLEAEDGVTLTKIVRPPDTEENQQERASRIQLVEAENQTMMSQYDSEMNAWNALRAQHLERDAARQRDQEEAQIE